MVLFSISSIVFLFIFNNLQYFTIKQLTYFIGLIITCCFQNTWYIEKRCKKQIETDKNRKEGRLIRTEHVVHKMQWARKWERIWGGGHKRQAKEEKEVGRRNFLIWRRKEDSQEPPQCYTYDTGTWTE